MFRFEVGARVLVRNYDWDVNHVSIEVCILEKIPNHIKVTVESEGWGQLGEVLWLDDLNWYVYRRVSNKGE